MKLLCKSNNEKGQAIFEFLIFLPFILIIYSITVTIGNAINASINQQKITRGYFFNLQHGNSYAPSLKMLRELQGVRKTGMVGIGWRMKDQDKVPVAPCYKLISLSKETKKSKCLDPSDGTSTTTQFIRVKTAYGVCGTTYDLQSGQATMSLNVGHIDSMSADYTSCTNSP